jgi:hypothetical protein
MKLERERRINWGCYYILFEKNIVQSFVQCHILSQLPPDRRPND